MSSASRDAFVARRDSRPDDECWPDMSCPLPPDVELRGRLVDLRPFDDERDAAALFNALDHDVVWMHVAGRPQQSQDLAEAMQRRLAKGNVPWVARLAQGHAGLPAGSVVGTSSYLDVSPDDARLEIGSTAYAPQVWGTAVNADVKLQLLAHAFDVLGVGRVQLKTDVRNVRSQKAIARLGARYEGTLRRYRRRADGTVRDTVLFSVVAEEWPGVRDGLHERLAAAGKAAPA